MRDIRVIKKTGPRSTAEQKRLWKYRDKKIREAREGSRQGDYRTGRPLFSNPAALYGTVDDIPSQWTPCMVRKVGGAVQIKMRGR